ncbi:hypothetical protein B0T26DRAFT_647868 [Lasiosphaeria miniovina]|uniref:Macro domain-containing protein n=1 Tax=Lasiosphaeria miniovina TaxID=1954250 RepID=A0AA40ALB7_9PEZI|nr:uncharacterized protein B0T26DRAFT_647868 [Lasiosphaeria miniovina]KAK0717939.1 hypothetical protein B0T26DRAFT_647868 [Lasiosphaeria miniovina]
MTVINASDIPTLSLLYKLHKLVAAPAGTKPRPTLAGPKTIPAPSKALNDRVGVVLSDITTLGVDAIVNAAKRSLLGGGGVDGAIHRAAGAGLVRECERLGGCETGAAKITGAYRLPCRRVIHAVGPVYDPGEHEASETALASCYTRSLELAAENGCRSVAFSALSTGVYGYPSRWAAPAALSAVRKFLVDHPARAGIDKVIFVTFEKKDVDAYNESVPIFFPPVPDEEAEAEAVANELPDPPTGDPVNPENDGKRQKHD